MDQKVKEKWSIMISFSSSFFENFINIIQRLSIIQRKKNNNNISLSEDKEEGII